MRDFDARSRVRPSKLIIRQYFSNSASTGFITIKVTTAPYVPLPLTDVNMPVGRRGACSIRSASERMRSHPRYQAIFTPEDNHAINNTLPRRIASTAQYY